jgi:hypothetical protein
MRLTVGPLPAAVYWRRRAVVLVGLSMVVLIAWYALSGPEGSANPGAVPTQTGSPTPAPQTSDAPSPRESSPSPTPSAFTLPVSAATGPCTDSEMEVIAKSASAEVASGTPVPFTITIKNTSPRTCVRDVGADVQELLLQAEGITIWSSDDCGANHGQDLKEFAAGMEVSYTRTWPGHRSRGGNNTVECTAPVPGPGVYQLVARLDRKLSPPFDLKINPS